MKRVLRQLPYRVACRRDCPLAASVYSHGSHTLAMLEQFGPMEGWTCVDIRCGPGGITDFLSPPVGSTGRVVGLDMDHQFLERARRRAPHYVKFQLGDAYGSPLPAGIFNLVHTRFIASNAGNPEQTFQGSDASGAAARPPRDPKTGWLEVEVLSAACGLRSAAEQLPLP